MKHHRTFCLFAVALASACSKPDGDSSGPEAASAAPRSNSSTVAAPRPPASADATAIVPAPASASPPRLVAQNLPPLRIALTSVSTSTSINATMDGSSYGPARITKPKMQWLVLDAQLHFNGCQAYAPEKGGAASQPSWEVRHDGATAYVLAADGSGFKPEGVGTDPNKLAVNLRGWTKKEKCPDEAFQQDSRMLFVFVVPKDFDAKGAVFGYHGAKVPLSEAQTFTSEPIPPAKR